MGLFGVLLLSFGAFCIVAATECVPETAKCSVYWEKILPHKNLIASEDELDLWCSKQTRFYECLEGVLLEGRNGNLSYLPTNLLVSKLFSQDLCTDTSTNRKRLLSSADCINQLDTDFCVLPEYLDIVTPDDSIPSTRCSQAEKTFSCIAATIVLNCGFDAGRVYRTMLKITRYSDEVCGIETSEGVPPCEETYSKSRDDKLSDIYYGLFHRIGSLLDDESKEDASTDSTVEEDVPENPDEIVTKALQMTLDSLDENVASEECDSPECLDLASDSRSVSCSKNTGEYKPYMKNPVITEVFKELLFYNYSGHEYAAYWRQPDFNIFHSIECNHLQPSNAKGVIFRCKIEYRYEDPDCLSDDTVYEKVTPEFILNLDPEVPCDSEAEFGTTRPEWKDEEAYEEKNIRDQMKHTPASAVTENPAILALRCLFEVVSTACSRKNFHGSEAFKMFRIFPDAIHDEMVDLFIPDKNELSLMNRIQAGGTIIILIYDPELTKSIENVTCSRLDECNPRGRGLWKCKMWPRNMDTCDSCGAKRTEDTYQGIRYAKPSESYVQTLEITEPTVIVDGSGNLEDSTPLGESIALLFSGDNEAKNLASVDPNADVNIVSDFLSIDDETNSEDQYRLEETEVNESDTTKPEYSVVPDTDDTEVEFQIMSIFNSDEASESSEVAYEVDNTNADDNSNIIIATDASGLLSGNFVLVKDVSDFNEPTYTVVSL